LLIFIFSCVPLFSETIDSSYFRKVDPLDPGTIHLFIKNTTASMLSVTGIYLNGTEMKDMPNDLALWYQTVPPVAQPEEVMDVMVKLRRETKKLIRIETTLNTGEKLSSVIEPVSPDIKFTFIGYSKEKDKVYLYLENTGKENLEIQKVFCNTKDITNNCFLPCPVLPPSSKTLIIHTLREPLSPGRYLSFKAVTEKGETAQAISRVYSHFPIEAFGKDTRPELSFDPDCFALHYPKKKEEFQKIKEEPLFKAIHLLDDPACVDGYACALIGTSAKEVVKRGKECYENDPVHPTSVYSCEHGKPYCYFVYGETTDIMVIDPYEIIFYHNEPEKNAYYTRLAKLASEPRLLWTIPEAFTYRGTRFPTSEEERIIVYSEIGEGSKGIWYYVYDKKLGYPANKGLEEEIKKINRELQKLKDYIVISEPFPLAKVEIEKVTPYSLLCGDKGIVLILVNNDHESYFEEGKQPFTYQPKENFQVRINIPGWLKIKQIKEINYNGEKEVKYLLDKDNLIIPIDSLDITRQFFIEVERR